MLTSLCVTGNSYRGLQFCSLLVKRYNFHYFDALKGSYPSVM